ncbi:uncharacterized protein GGS25DRAFT_517004 [Hypoxylon fragiforme]|uniref:uncharacterized protein n=1 Tax=Hypoxylon fragiforme TaxID=63214 RepID=UPI0020C69AF7|nr:uncharacterized protein GGS25DRAFT_517004 [Hypoxylon fragiforme]KAI2614151.1 hypothetical protein GGS25DRAFT_517004 [Hypoxylon fragiforme]
MGRQHRGNLASRLLSCVTDALRPQRAQRRPRRSSRRHHHHGRSSPHTYHRTSSSGSSSTEYSHSERRRRRAIRQSRFAGPDAMQLRRLASSLWARGARLSDADLFQLAVLERVYFDRPERRGGPRQRLRGGLAARLARMHDVWWFLGTDGLFWKSADRWGQGRDLVHVVDVLVPIGIRIKAQPYRQLNLR